MVCNFSKDSEYHTQINNKFVPHESCNTTSMVMALKQAGIKLPPHKGQPEDALTALLKTKEAYEKQEELAPWSINKFQPQEVHMVLQWGVNKWIGHNVDEFISDAKLSDLREILDDGKGIVISGTFPLQNTELHHMVSLAGYIIEDKITHYIIDDPYGDWLTRYANNHGNNIPLSVETFDAIFNKGLGKYWIHIVGE